MVDEAADGILLVIDVKSTSDWVIYPTSFVNELTLVGKSEISDFVCVCPSTETSLPSTLIDVALKSSNFKESNVVLA